MKRIELNKKDVEYYHKLSQLDVPEWDELLIGILNYNRGKYNDFDSIWKVRHDFENWYKGQWTAVCTMTNAL